MSVPDVQESFYKEMDLKFVKFCDAILMVEGWEKSEGSKAEQAEAARLGKPVLMWTDTDASLLAWASR